MGTVTQSSKQPKSRGRTSREVFVRLTRVPAHEREYHRLCGWLTLDREDDRLVSVTFDPILDDDVASIDIDVEAWRYDADERKYRIRDADDHSWWTFTQLRKVD